MATKKTAAKRARSAKTGKLVTKAAVKASPETTVTETVEQPLDEFIRKYKLPKMPKREAAMADLLYTTRENRLRLKKIIDEIENFEKELKNHFIENLSKSDSTGVAGKLARVQIVTDTQPVVADWDEFYKHIKKKGEFELLNRAPNRTAIRERWEAGKTIPGIDSFQVVKVSVTKVGG